MFGETPVNPAPMEAMTLRSRGDCELAQKLLEDRFVENVIENLEKADDGPGRVRRELLATAIRLTETMMPDVHAVVNACRERLTVDIPLEIYVYPSATFNAACVKPEAGRLFVMLSSSLLESFPEPERRFVIGHELGHHLFGHHGIPIGSILSGKARPPAELALRLFAWSRYAEVSADRAGAVCADDPDAVARSLFRLASGLTGSLDHVGIDDFVSQVDDLQIETQEPGVGASEADWFSTHPFSPLRLKALNLFLESEFVKDGGFEAHVLEARVQTLMALMEPSYLEEKSESAETARRLLLAGAIAVADVVGGVSDPEIAIFEKFFGEDSFNEKLDVGAIKASLDDRIAAANGVLPHARRIQVVRDLCVVARADDHVSPEECQLIERLSSALEVPLDIVSGTLCGECECD